MIKLTDTEGTPVFIDEKKILHIEQIGTRHTRVSCGDGPVFVVETPKQILLMPPLTRKEIQALE